VVLLVSYQLLRAVADTQSDTMPRQSLHFWQSVRMSIAGSVTLGMTWHTQLVAAVKAVEASAYGPDNITATNLVWCAVII
jgi:hypothetical protein